MAQSTPTRVPPRRFFLLFYVFTLVFVMVTHGWNDLQVAIHPADTTATVTGGGARSAIYYQYQVNGQTYSAQGRPSGTGPWPIGSTFPIRYSATQPSYSTPQWPLGFLGQLAIMWAFITVMLAVHFKRQKAAAATASPSST